MRRPRRFAVHRRAVLALLLLLPAGGCAWLRGTAIDAPVVTVAQVGLARPGVLSQELALTLDLRNRMARDLAIDSVSVDVEVNGARIGSGVVLETVALPANGTASLSVPVTVRTADLLDALARVGRSQRLAYAIDGRLALGGSDAGASVPFDDAGELTLPTLPLSGLAPPIIRPAA